MALTGKPSGFYRDGQNWFCNAALPSDIIVAVEGILFHLHKFPLLSKCGKIANILRDLYSMSGEVFRTELFGCPGGPDAFLAAAMFCYGERVDLTPKNIIPVYCVANYLKMTEDYGEDNLLVKSESFFHRTILRNWKDCILALQSSESVLPEADTLQIVDKSLSALSVMACTDPTLFGWPMMMYGSTQSPGGSILWNGINTGARIRSSESDWWFEDISYLSVQLFKRVLDTMKVRGVRPEKLAGAVMHYARKYLPGLVRWQNGRGGKPVSAIVSFCMTPAVVDQRLLLESIEEMLPPNKGKSFCRFLLGLLRIGMILNMSHAWKDSMERRISMQLEFATLDSLLLPTFSDSDNLYDYDCVQRIIMHFLSSEASELTPFSPSSFEAESPPSGSLRRVAKLIDSYLAEIAPDANLKPEKMCSLAEALPESSRNIHDGLYRALDIYFKAHPWLAENDKEQLFRVISCQKLSLDACAHASQNERLPLRIILQVLFFEQLHMRSALAGILHVSDNDSGTAAAAASDMAGQIMQRDGWFTVVRENQVLRVDMETMRSRVRDLEREFGSIKQEMQKAAKPSSSLISPRLVSRRTGFNLLQHLNPMQLNTFQVVNPSPRQAVEQGHSSHHSRHLKASSVLTT